MLTFEMIRERIIKDGGVLSGSRLRGDDRDGSDWDYWLSREMIVSLAEWLTRNKHPWSAPFDEGLRVIADGKVIDVCSLFPKTIDECIRREKRARRPREISVRCYHKEDRIPGY